MGSGIVCTDFIVQSGAVVEDGAQISRTFVGQGVKLSRGFTCSDCLFFANSHCENGEAVSVFAGPFTVSHHKATLMIGAMFSFMNAGSATTKCGSGSYMMLPVKVAPFTTVLGHHTSVIDTSLMPFSYVVESEGGSVLVPGANLRSIGLFRDMRKGQARRIWQAGPDIVQGAFSLYRFRDAGRQGSFGPNACPGAYIREAGNLWRMQYRDFISY